MSEAVVYRMFDSSGALLYVGLSMSLPARLAGHRADKQWWPEIATISVEHFASRDAAAEAEVVAIRLERPAHNRSLGRGVTPQSVVDERRRKRAEEKARRAAEAEAKRYWDPRGAIECRNCKRRPDRFPVGRAIEKVPCKQCGVCAFAVEQAA